MNKILEIEEMTYRSIPVDDHYVIVNETDYLIVSDDAEDKLRRHLWSHEEGVI